MEKKKNVIRDSMIAFYYSTKMLFILSSLRLLITYTKAPFIPLVGFDRKMNESNYNWVYIHSCIPVEVPTNDLEKVRTPSLIGLGCQWQLDLVASVEDVMRYTQSFLNEVTFMNIKQRGLKER